MGRIRLRTNQDPLPARFPVGAQTRRYLEKVRRLHPGEEVELSNHLGKAAVYLAEQGGEELTLIHSRDLEVESLAGSVTIIQPLLIRRKLELAIQKCVELGVDEIVLFRAARSQSWWDDKEVGERLSRLEKISNEACRQCGRRAPVRLVWLDRLKRIGDILRAENRFMLHEETPEGFLLGEELITGDLHGLRLAMAVGPEGGLTEEEVDILRNFGFLPVYLGRLILRTETASMAAALLGALAVGRTSDQGG